MNHGGLPIARKSLQPLEQDERYAEDAWTEIIGAYTEGKDEVSSAPFSTMLSASRSSSGRRLIRTGWPRASRLKGLEAHASPSWGPSPVGVSSPGVGPPGPRTLKVSYSGPTGPRVLV